MNQKRMYDYEKYRIRRLVEQVAGGRELYEQYSADRDRIAVLVRRHYKELGRDGGDIVARFWMYRGEEDELTRTLYNPGNVATRDIFMEALKSERGDSRVRAVEYRGKTYSIAELARLVGVPPTTIRTRLAKGMSVEDAVTVKGRSDEGSVCGRAVQSGEQLADGAEHPSC